LSSRRTTHSRAKQDELRQELTAAQHQLSELQGQFITQGEDLSVQNAALDATRQLLHTEQTTTARLFQAHHDLELRVQDKEGQIRSLEEKHLHARDALEHYRNSVKEQREQEQRRHEGQLQQVQMELRQAQQSAMVRQDDITQLNRDNERLLAETRSTLRELSARQEQLNKATNHSASLSQQHTHTQCALLQERLSAAQSESDLLKQALAEQQQSNQTLQLELIKAQQVLENLRTSHSAINEVSETPIPQQP
jgi:chromosome segregation ATPase